MHPGSGRVPVASGAWLEPHGLRPRMARMGTDETRRTGQPQSAANREIRGAPSPHRAIVPAADTATLMCSPRACPKRSAPPDARSFMRIERKSAPTPDHGEPHSVWPSTGVGWHGWLGVVRLRNDKVITMIMVESLDIEPLLDRSPTELFL